MANFRINVIIDPKGARSGGRVVKRELRGIENSGRRAGRVLASAFAFAGLSLGIGQLVSLGNEFGTIQNQLRVVTNSTDELTAAQGRLFQIAQTTRQEFRSVVQLYSRASIAAGELGASQEQLFRLVEITGKALAVQGGAASESSGAIRQLSQAFSSGIVRAEEFNSILEGAFPLALAAAAGIDEAGGSVGRLRNLIVAGEIGSRQFFEGILKGGEQLDEQFGKTLPIVSQGFTVLRNSLLSFTGAVDSSIGVTASLSGLIIDLAFAVDDLAKVFTGTLGPEEEVSSGLKVFASVALVTTRIVGALADSLLSQLGLAFTIVGEAAGAFAAQIAALFRGDFAGAKAIGEDFKDRFFAGFTETFTELREELVGETSETIETLVKLWDSAARDIQQAQAAAVSAPDAGPDVEGGLTDEEIKKQQAFIQTLQQQAAVLAIQTALLDDADATLLEYNTVVAAAKLGNEEFQLAALEAAQAINAQTEALRAAEEAQQRQMQDISTLDFLREELRLLQLTREERAIQVALADLSVDATAAQRAEVEQLAAEIFALEEVERAQLAFLDQFVRDAATAARSQLSGALSDPLLEGFEQIPAKFAGVLQDLASQFLASEIFKLLSSIGEGGGGGFLSSIGSFFGQGAGLPGFQGGGSFQVGGSGGPDSQVVAFRASPMENVNVTRPGQEQRPIVVQSMPAQVQVINVTDPSEIPAAMESAKGEEVILNTIRNNPDMAQQLSS